jgi:hypothetical protein
LTIANEKDNRVVPAPTLTLFEDDNVARFTTVLNQVAAGETSVTLQSGDGWKCVAGTLLYVPRTNELMRVTTVSTDTLTVTRSVGAPPAAPLLPNEVLVIINGAAAEGASVGNARTSLKTPKTFYTQIFREAYSVSGTAENTKTYGPISIRSEQQKKALINHMVSMEHAFCFGQQSSAGTGVGGDLVTTTTSLEEQISYSVTSDGPLTEIAFQEALNPIFETGSPEKLFISGLNGCNMVSNYSTNKLQTGVGDTTYGNRIKTYRYGGGDITIIPSPKTFTSVLANRFYIVDNKFIGRIVQQNRDTSMTEITRKDNLTDGITGEYLTQAGLYIFYPDAHCKGRIN